MRRALGFGLFVAVAVVTLAFLTLPIVGIFVHTSPGKVLDQLSNPVVKDAFVVTLQDERDRPGADPRSSARRPPTCSPPAASRATRSRSRSSSCRSCSRRPSPASGCSTALGRYGLLGSSLHALGVRLPFTQTAVTVAVAYVASPLYIRQAIASFEATDPRLTAASRTLGAGPGPHLLPRRAAARARRADRRARALVRARAGRVRSDDHVRGQPAGCHPDAVARDLLRVRRRTSTRAWR